MYTIQEFDKEKSKVMNYIMYKKRTEYEVKNKFQNTIQKDLLCDIITYVKQAGYLDDTVYIERAVHEFMALKNLSTKEIQYKLLSKGIDLNTIEDYISENREKLEEYELSSATNLLEKKLKNMEQEEIKLYLMKKGYKHQTIKEVLECKMY